MKACWLTFSVLLVTQPLTDFIYSIPDAWQRNPNYILEYQAGLQHMIMTARVSIHTWFVQSVYKGVENTVVHDSLMPISQ